jgi:hypothetical protein
MTPLLACALALSTSLQAPSSDRVALWTDDALFLVEEYEHRHPRPWFGCPREEFERSMDAFLTGLEGWSEERTRAEFMRLFARLSEQGRDGHSAIWPTGGGMLPLQLYSFVDGWFVVSADAAELVGARVTALGGVPIEEVASRLAPLLTRDNEWNLRAKLALALLMTELLTGVDVPARDGAFELSLERAGKRETRAFTARPGGLHAAFGRPDLPARPGARWLARRDEAFRYEILDPGRTLYLQYNEVTTRDAHGRTLADFTAEVVRVFGERECQRLVLDVRSNGGGDNTTFGPLIDALKAPPFERHGVLFALIGRGTFSAAGNFVTALERDTRAILIGEPTGGAPNQYGDAQTVVLPNHADLLVRVSTRYHQFARADDPRLTHEPHLAVPLRSGDYFTDQDPVLAAALAYVPPK